MKHTPRQILMDLAELQEIETELAQLKKLADGEELSELEHQEATGILLVRCLQNPELFRRAASSVPIDLGKYKAICAVATLLNSGMSGPAEVRVKFERS